MTKDPKSERDYSPEVRDLLERGQTFETQTGGVVTFQETRKRREPDGLVSYVAVFDVVEEDDYVFGPTYTTTEYLALHRIETGALEPTEA